MALSTRRTGRSRFTLLVLVLASITLLTLDFRDSGPVQSLRDGAAAVFDPVRDATDGITEPIGNAWDGIFGYDDLKKENDRLRERVDELEAERTDADVANRENQALKDQLAIKQTSDIPTLAAEVVSGPLTSFDATISINRGSGDGVKKGMSVVTKAGLVGRVVRVTGGRSTVRLITDPSFRFGIQLADLGDRGIAHGTGREGTLEVEQGIDPETPVRRGDRIVTASGDFEGAAIPPRLPVGRVDRVGFTDDRTEKTLVIEPAADLHALSFVTVLLCDDDCS
jgi:rod shape-determining protein MreC